MGIVDLFRRPRAEVVAERGTQLPLSVDDWIGMISSFSFQGVQYTLPGRTQEDIGSSFVGLARGGMKGNGVVFACIANRVDLFSEARFMFRRLRGGRPGDLFGTAELRPLNEPWAGGTTGDLLARMLQYVDIAGNAYVVRRGDYLTPLRPDWVTILAGVPGDEDASIWHPDAEVLGYAYTEGGPGSGNEPTWFLADEVAHFAPRPDPEARFRGMSWLTPIVREIMADKAMNDHKLAFLENGATPNIAVKLNVDDLEKFKGFVKEFQAQHAGASNAYKTMFLAAGADVVPVGTDLKQLDFKITQGGGEPLALDTPIPTPDGWTTMGEIEPGDFVFGREGTPARVAAVSPVHEGRDCFRVTFSDRTSIVADAGHIWQVIDRNGAGNPRPERTITTEEIAAGIAEWEIRGTGGNRYGVPAGRPVELDERDLLVDPYVLGAWLGDGATAGAAICGAQPDLDFIAAEIESRGYTVTRWATVPGKVAVIGIPAGLLAALDALGVLGNKHIPAEYLRASLTQRLDLLRGLMDTDGSVGSIGKESCEFSSKWELLARQVAELSRSLGYRSTISRRTDGRSRTGEHWRVTFRADPEVVPFLLERKAERCVTPVWVKNRAIVSVEPVASVPVRCIAVETPDHLFRAGEGWTLTHNTRIAAAAGVPPVIVGLSEGLAAATYSNYSQARRRFADQTMRPLWRNAAGSLARIIRVPSDAELWYDDRDISALQEDQRDAAEIQATRAQSIRTLLDAGYTAESVVAAITNSDFALLAHSGLFSVQLQKPGSGAAAGAAAAAAPAPVPARQPDPLDLLESELMRMLRDERDERLINVNVQPPDVQVDVHPAQVTVEPAQVTVEPQRWEEGAIQVRVEAAPAPDVNVTVEAPSVTVDRAGKRRVSFDDGRSATVTDGDVKVVEWDDGRVVRIEDVGE